MNSKVAVDRAAIKTEEDAEWNAAPVRVLGIAVCTYLVKRMTIFCR
jgi:hypothetical protein